MTGLAAALTQALDATFPRVAFTMAYGSGVFRQKNHDASASMVDLVFAVDDPQAWHEQNLDRNPHHYSLLKFLGASNVAAFQENFGAGVYYNTLVPLTGKLLGTRLIKYGVVSTKTLCEDLQTWKTLYLSGRMHKPKIAGISYLGDFRMSFGENPKKVRNIVDGNFKSFQEIYQHKIKNSPFMSRSLSGGDLLVANSMDLTVRQTIVEALPSNISQRLAAKSQGQLVSKKHLQRVVASIVFRSSRSQSIKGIATAGGVKSIVYVAQKLKRTYFKTKK
ncbi:hypothetical protein BBO99_00005677 [Phytophthora kernoviae]|uniref:Phosphatidate cytidylyltransferase, mitochondrial n=2 Tax=Phytophthora kernoviae TaxID=325452 RepID=A0A3R7K648_9STRA|nr:hypothetical protein G195_011288 [Phytophthora kernoviae 00238/432]KAG2506854.1 hypothetical protein JM16_008966 [Phytophthora kernoviae]KAG2508220.1 hypothetical protein JM18_009224 [Phytophthora kernoviae]RLN25843.1 hypothetical protein BBI17_005633 [Phytophthora kernoviae]RLN78839.1 hypothetical protein BBO99_00005677 [Phytophthora kernoviae]